MRAQGLFGGVIGTVTDATGSVVPGASVTLTNIGTSEARAAKTDATGNYRFVDLQPANYRLQIEMTGFKQLIGSQSQSRSAPSSASTFPWRSGL